jgi:Uri superfamily endonuclease
MNGTYVLVINVDRPHTIKIGKLGYLKLLEGYYAYVGSELNNLGKRVERHLRLEK